MQEQQNKLILLAEKNAYDLQDNLSFMITHITNELKPMICDMEAYTRRFDNASKQLENIEKSIANYNDEIVNKINTASIGKVVESIEDVSNEIRKMSSVYEEKLDEHLKEHVEITKQYINIVKDEQAKILKDMDINKIQQDVIDRVLESFMKERKKYFERLGFDGLKGFEQITQEKLDTWHIGKVYQVLEQNIENASAKAESNVSKTNHLLIAYGFGTGLLVQYLLGIFL